MRDFLVIIIAFGLGLGLILSPVLPAKKYLSKFDQHTNLEEVQDILGETALIGEEVDEDGDDFYLFNTSEDWEDGLDDILAMHEESVALRRV